MRNNLLQIYHKLGKTFDVGDIAARFSYVHYLKKGNFEIISHNDIFILRIRSTRYSRSDCDDGDSRFSFSNSSSPQHQVSILMF